jgi:hypothetical protein
MSDKHYLLWHCQSRQNNLIVAPSFKSMIETLKVAQEKYWDVKVLKYYVGTEVPLPEWYQSERERAIELNKVKLFASYVEYTIRDYNDLAHLLKACPVAVEDDYHGKCVCLGTGFIPVKETWGEMYERAATLPCAKEYGWTPKFNRDVRNKSG